MCQVNLKNRFMVLYLISRGMWLRVHLFMLGVTSSVSVFSMLKGERPSPVMLLVGIIQAMTVHHAWEYVAKARR